MAKRTHDGIEELIIRIRSYGSTEPISLKDYAHKKEYILPENTRSVEWDDEDVGDCIATLTNGNQVIIWPKTMK